MAITRTQIAKQLLANGGRTGFQGGGRDASTRSFAESQGRSRSEVSQLGRDFGFSGRDVAGDSGRQRPDSVSAIIPPKKPKIKEEKRFRFIPPTASFFNFLGKKIGETETARRMNAFQRQNFLRTLPIEQQVEALEDLAKIGIGTDNPMGITRNIDRGMEDKGFLGTGIGGGKFITDIAFGEPEAKAVLDQFGYDDYLKRNEKDPQPDGVSDPCLGPNPPAYCFVGIRSVEPEKEEDEDPVNLRLLAEGGRAGFQEGGGIEQRLEKLGGDVSSAEKMLQGINQRLKTAESSLGSGGANTVTVNAGMQQPTVLGGGLGTLAPGVPTGLNKGPENVFMGNMLPSNADPQTEKLTPLGNNFPGLGIFPPTADQLQVGEMGQIPEQFREGYAEYMKGKPIPMGGQAISYVTLPGGGTVAFGDTGSAGSFREYLKSTGFTPPMSPLLRPVQLPDLQPGITQDLATQVVQSPQQDPNIFGYDPSGSASIQDRYSTAQQAAEKARKEGFAGRIKLPGEMSFEEFSDLYDKGAFTPLRAAGSDDLGFVTLESLGNFGKKAGIPVPRGGYRFGEFQNRNIGGIPAAGYADGGDVVGGEYDFESARQAYGLGKLVKKITRSVKKIAKSPLGKVAIGAALFHFGKPLVKSEGFKNFFLKKGATDFTLANLSTKGALTGIAGISALGGLTAVEDDEEQQYAGADFPNPIDFYLSGQAPMNTRLAAEGGLMRAGYQEGSKEPVAKKTMPLLDMGGMEKDYREEGGFVPIGRMEKADDVPARLSKNEFVFTADAVRNAGDGDVDLGAEKMYNMMKNLEAGGDVSEESQGLKGAREMFQTSQRLEEVL